MKAFDGKHKTCSMKCPKELWFGGKAEVQIFYARESEMNDRNRSVPSFAVDQLGLQDLWHHKIEGRESCNGFNDKTAPVYSLGFSFLPAAIFRRSYKSYASRSLILSLFFLPFT